MDEKGALAKKGLTAFAVGWLAEWSGGEIGPLLDGFPQDASQALAPYQAVLGTGWTRPEPGDPLLSIFARIQPEEGVEPPRRYWKPAPLSLEPVEPVEEVQARAGGLTSLWQGFKQDLQTLNLPIENARPFETFAHLLHKWAWAVPCSYGEPGVSLYDEFRALSALVHASGYADEPADEFLLVGGDVPGIQKTIYTITSKGAAKGLRGRSFFIQLLGDAVVQRILSDLGLPETNLIYAAGGNFALLAPVESQDTVESIAAEINRGLLDAFEGDLALCVACQRLPKEQVGSGAFGRKASRDLHQKIAGQKRRRFAGIAHEPAGWETIFGPQGQGKPDFCSICQHEQGPGERGEALPGEGWMCQRCAGFADLAQTIARDDLYLSVSSEPGRSGQAWQNLLYKLTRQWYSFAAQAGGGDAARVYQINSLKFGPGVDGFRLIANTTPRVTQADRERWEESQEPEEECPQPGTSVRTFSQLADAAHGISRVGVLRMDVDDLGRVLTQWLQDRTMAATSALSDGLERFFSGWLDAICRQVTQSPPMEGAKGGREDLVYVIYAGGDDLFVVGAWDVMPLLAESVRQRFTQYVGQNPHLHISAGITLESRKFPLYQAAERAGDALDHGAKESVRQVNGREIKKDALDFLGQTLGWEAYPFVKDLVERLIWLIEERKVSRGLLSVLRAIVARYKQDVERARERDLKGEKVYYGPWMWRKVYQLSRMQQRYKDEVAQVIKELETEVLTIEHMPYIGLATRWAEYLTRGGKE